MSASASALGAMLPGVTSGAPLRAALRAAATIGVDSAAIDNCLDHSKPADALFARARAGGLTALTAAERRGHLCRVIGEVAEAIAQMLFSAIGYEIIWQITTPGVRGVDLLLLSPDEAVLALEVKGTLRAGAIPRLTPSRLRQMSREWLNDPANLGVTDWQLEADDLYTSVAIIDLAASMARLAVSSDFELYQPIIDLVQLEELRALG